MIYNLCKEKGWQCLGGAVQYPDEKLPITEIREGIFYHGSPLKLDFVKAGCDITPYKELVMAFSHKPTGVFIINEVIIHNGIQDGYLYIIDEEIDINTDIIQHPNSSFEKGYEMLTQRDLKLKLISEVKIFEY